MNDSEDYLLENNYSYIEIDDKRLDDTLRVLVLMYGGDAVIVSESVAGMCTALSAVNVL